MRNRANSGWEDNEPARIERFPRDQYALMTTKALARDALTSNTTKRTNQGFALFSIL